MLQRTEGIVLRNSPYGEADLFVAFLTSDYGLVNTFAKSPRKIKSRFGSSLEPLTYSRISFWGKEDSALPRLTQSDIIRPFQGIREKMDFYLKASELLELTLRFLPEKEANREIFSLLLEVLTEIEKESVSIELASAFYRVRFLHFSGHAPRLWGCARCRRPLSSSGGSAPFYVSQGAIICRQCAPKIAGEEPISLSPSSLKLYESLRKWNASKLSRIKPSSEIIAELENMLDAHAEYILSMPLRAKGFSLPQKYILKKPFR